MDTATISSQMSTMMENARKAARELEGFSQEQVDAIVRELGYVVYENAEPLAKMAVEETEMGDYNSKVLKNKSKSENIQYFLKGMKSVGVINRDEEKGLYEVAEPVGVVAAIIPCTNPTVTAMSNSMFAIKGRNPVIVAPHPRATKTTVKTVEMMVEAAKKVGLPENAIQVIRQPSKELSQELMASVDVILATGGPGMVKAAYSSGKPSYGVGAGNVPCAIHSSANIEQAVSDILVSKKFDNGLICSSEQTVIVTKDIADQVAAEFEKQGAYIVSPEEKAKLKEVAFPGDSVHPSPEVIGQYARDIAKKAGITVPEGKDGVLITRICEIGAADPFSGEKMCPILALYVTNTFEETIDAARRILEYQGTGHTADIHTQDMSVVEPYALAMKASRVLVNQPSATSAGGSKVNSLLPTTTLGCGSWGNNASTDNINVKHVINIKRIAFKLATAKDTSSAFDK